MNLASLLASPAFMIFAKWTVLLAFGWLAHFALRHQHARWRVILWRGVLCIGLVLPATQWLSLSIVKLPLASPTAPPPMVSLSLGTTPTTTRPLATPSQFATTTETSHTPAKIAAALPAVSPAKPLPWGRIILSVWGLGALLGALRLAGLQMKLVRLRGSAESSSQSVRDLAGQIQNQFYLPGTVDIRLSEKVSSPFVCGLLQPIVILPKTLMSKLSASEANALLSHELAHLRQNDLIWCLAWRWVAVAFWFHPLVWAIPSAHNLACEQEADRIAARTLPQEDSYPQLLARLVLLVHAMPAVETELTLNGSSKIVQRLKYLERSVHRPWDWRHLLAAYSLITVLFLLTAGLAVSGQYQTSVRGSSNPGNVTAGLVAHWTGDGHGKDSAGGHDATVPDGIIYEQANVGKGFGFDGGEHRMIVADTPDLNMGAGQDFSIEAWIKTYPSPILAKGQASSPDDPGLTDGIMTIIDKRETLDFTRSVGYELCLRGGTLHLHMSDSVNGNGASWGEASGYDLRDGKFHHVAVTVSRNSPDGGKMYLDGKLLQTFDPTDVPGDLSNDQPLRIGNHPDPFYHCFFKGVIGEVSLFRRALSTDEVMSLYAKGGGQPVASDSASPTAPVDPQLQAQAKGSHPNGLVALWSGQGNGVDTVSGLQAELTDVSYNGENAARAFSFNGTTSTIKIPANPAVDLGANDGLTVMAWIKPADVNGLHPIVEWADYGGLNLWVGIRPFEDGVLRGDVGDSKHNNFVCSQTNVLVSDAYQHVAMTYDKTSGISVLYINGVMVAQRQLGVNLVARTKGNVWLSHRNAMPGDWSSDRMFSGLMNNLEFYNRALSASEIQSVCNAENPGETLTKPDQSDGWFEPTWML